MKKYLILFLIFSISTLFSLQFKHQNYEISITGNFDLQEQEITANGKTYLLLTAKECNNSAAAGLPKIPRFTKLVQLPANGNWQIDKQFYNTDEQTIGFELCRGEQENSQASQNKQDKWLPEKVVQISKPVIMRGIRFAQISVASCQYNPAKQKIRYFKDIDITLSIDSNKNSNPLLKNIASTPIFRQIAQQNITGFQSEKNSTTGSYLFICPENCASYLQELKSWKQQLGYHTKIATLAETGYTKDEIKNYLQNAYDNWEIPPENVILFGDVSGNYIVPSFYVEGGPYSEFDVSDHPYTLLEGDDYFPDIMLGRVSFQDMMQLMTVVNKIITYEKEPDTSVDWFTKAIMVGGISPNYDNYSPRETLLEARRKLLEFDYTTVHNHIYPEQTSQTSLENLINEGCSIINYRGCGSYDHWSSIDGYNIFANENLMNLNNGFKLPFVTSIVCAGGDFAVENIPSCFGEIWLNAGDPGQPKGAIGFIGPSEYNTSTAWNNCHDLGIYQGFTQEGINTCAGLMLRGKMELYNNFPDCHEWGGPEESDQLYFFVYNLLGDPGLRVLHSPPQPFQLNCPDQLDANQNYLPVTIENVQNAAEFTVSITAADSLIAVAKTNSAGSAYLPVPTEITEFSITTSKYGFIPITKDISRSSAQYLQLVQYSFEQPPQNNSSIQLEFTLKNNNSNAINSININLNSLDNYFQIETNSIYVESLLPQNTYTGIFNLTSQPAWQNQQCKNLIIEVNSASGNQEFLVQTQLLSPEVIFSNFQTTTRDYLLPNSIQNIYLELENIGVIATGDFTANLSSLSPRCQILQATAGFSSIDPENFEMSNNPLQIEVFDVYPGSSANFLLQIMQAGNSVFSTQFELPVGLVSETAPTYSKYGYCAIESRDAGNFDIPAYNWIEINPEYGGNGVALEYDFITYDGAVEIVPLPFWVNYFEHSYDTISICTDGWFSMGVCEQVFHRNRQIPSGNGPNSIVAPFWDELENGQVHYYYDSENNQFIVQWTNWENYDNDQNTFQAIIFDPDYYQTPSADVKILFQYKEVHNEDQENNYATVGIENYTEDDGINMSYANRQPSSAHPLESETAILFTVDPYSDIPYLTSSPEAFQLNLAENETQDITLNLTNHSQFGEAIDFSVEFSHFTKQQKTERDISLDQVIRGNNGYIPILPMELLFYLFHNAQSEPVHGLSLDFPTGFTVQTASNLGSMNWNGETGDGATVTWGFGNGDNFDETGVQAFQVTVIIDENMTETVEIPWYIEGDGSGNEPHTNSGSIFIDPTSSGFIWLEYPNGGEHLIATSQDTIKWNSYGALDEMDIFIRYQSGGEWQILAENAPNLGEYIFQVPAVISNECKIMLSSGYINDFSAEEFQISALDISYPNAATEMLYAGQDSVIWENYGNITTIDIDISHDDGYSWQNLASNLENTGKFYFQVPGPTSPYCHLRLRDTQTGLTNKTTASFAIVDSPVDWLSTANTEGTVQANTTETLIITVDTSTLEPGEYTAYINIIINPGRIMHIPVELQVENSSNYQEIPAVTKLEQNYPNPFFLQNNRSNTAINFKLSTAVEVVLNIYNSRGQKVKTLINQKMPAGEHKLFWNGKDEQNKTLGSGIYFYNLQTPNRNITKKLILIK